MTKRHVQEILWFGAGFVLAAILSLSYDAERFIPQSVAFGLLCFGCGALLIQFLALRRQETGLRITITKSLNEWAEAFKKLNDKESKLNEDKEAWENKRDERETGTDEGFFKELARRLREEPDTVLDFHKGLLRIGEEEAARRGGEQIDKEMRDQDGQDEEGPN